MHTLARWTLGLVTPLVAFASEALPERGAVEVRFRHGDNPDWAARDWDDSDWSRISPESFPARAGIFWARLRVARGKLDPDALAGCIYAYSWPADKGVDSLFIASVFSFELYWDGRLIERSGVVGGSRAEESPGALDHLVRIPDELLGPGEHVMALRMSSYYYNFPASHFRPGILLTNYAERLTAEARGPIVPLVCLAGSLLLALTSEVLFRFVDRRRTLRLCGALSVTLAAFYGLIALRWLYNAPYPWHCPRLILITAVLSTAGGLLTWLLLEQFGVPRRRWWLAGFIVLLGVAWTMSPLYETKALWISRAMLALAISIAGWAIWHRRPGAGYALVGSVIGLFAVQTTGRAFLDSTFFLIFQALVLFVFSMIGMELQADRRRARRAELTAARLETELLKKNIQPHFLLNTLATIVEVIEQEPATAVALIEALASEFRILNRVSDKKLIPLQQELELCRVHLQVMGLRAGVRCGLAVDGIDERALVPPALFLTLVENGLTHLLPRHGEIGFRLCAEHAAGTVRYALRVDGIRQSGGPTPRLAVHPGSEPLPAPTVEGSSPAAPEGTGLRYIKARLEESFTGCWSFTSQPVAEGWLTLIEIHNPAARTRPVPRAAGVSSVLPGTAESPA